MYLPTYIEYTYLLKKSIIFAPAPDVLKHDNKIICSFEEVYSTKYLDSCDYDNMKIVSTKSYYYRVIMVMVFQGLHNALSFR